MACLHLSKTGNRQQNIWFRQIVEKIVENFVLFQEIANTLLGNLEFPFLEETKISRLKRPFWGVILRERETRKFPFEPHKRGKSSLFASIVIFYVPTTVI